MTEIPRNEAPLRKTHPVRAAAFSPDAHQLATACGDGTINLWDLAAEEEPHVWQAHVGDVTGVGYTADGRFLVSIGMDTAVRFWDSSTRELRLTMVSMSAEDYIAVTAKSSYMTSRGGLQSVVFRLGNRAVPFDQFDLNLNRPDQVYRELGYAYDDTIDAYHAAYERRLKRMGFRSSAGSNADDLELPTVTLVSAPPPASTTDRSLRLTVRAEGKHIPLERLLMYANEVPLPNMAGVRVPAAALTYETTVDVELKTGENLIQVSALNQAGTESIRESLRVAYVGDAPAATLHVLAVGVSEYAQQQLNLKYAAKDAEDLVATIREQQTHFGRVRSLLLLDDKASKDRILAARTFLMKSGADDQVILFFAGHGILEGSDYFFVPSNFDPGAVTGTTVRYEEIEALLDGIPARRRLVLIDTCHAGEVDETVAIERIETTPPQAATEVTSFRHSLPDTLTDVGRTVGVSDVLLAESFADLRRRSGAFVIAAAGASEYALEQADLRNGVFTSCVLEALRRTPSSRPLWADGILHVSELHRYVSEQVPKLTAGRQRPISRAENLVDDFAVI